MQKVKYQRVVLKISGESFCRPNVGGIDVGVSGFIADEIKAAAQLGTQLAVVVGGGNIVRGKQFEKLGINIATADYMGMVATVVNALALQDILEKKGAQTRLMTAIPMEAVAEPFIRRKCIRHLEKGRVVILAAGTGNPHFTTDTAAALRSIEINAQALLKATKVDGVYSADPNINKSARKYTHLNYMQVIKSKLQVMDSTAVTMCMETKIPVIVFNLKKKGNIVQAIRGDNVGTIIS
ncbi:MAG: UMP kinase [Candidatus Brocadiia bacterium]